MKTGYRIGYEKLWETMAIRQEHEEEVDWYILKLTKNRPRYDAVAEKTGVPWWFVGILHGLESAFNFKRHLHNGDSLLCRTTHVPRGRPAAGEPPFTWEESAIDAVQQRGFSGDKDWTDVAEIAYALESYSGFGYRKHGINSPYLWSGSNHYTKGKYASDGVYDRNLVSQQIGGMCILKRLMVLEPTKGGV